MPLRAPSLAGLLLLSSIAGLFLAPPTTACTVVVVGKNVTADGSVMVAHGDDGGTFTADLRLIKVPAASYPEGATRPVLHFEQEYPRIVAYGRGDDYKPLNGQKLTEPAGFIPQVRQTYAYWDSDYGIMNEKQVSIAESTIGAKTVGWGNNLPYGNCMFGIAELTKVALERCDSARCAVQTMGALAEKYGFYSEDSGDPAAPLYFLSAESAAIADPNEVWLFHVLTGPNNASAIWAAVRVPDDHVSVMADGMVIRELDLEDGEHYLASSNVHSYAIERGWWNPEEGPFDFTAAYAFDGDFVGEYPFYPLYVGRRIWRVLSLFAPSLSLDPRLGYIPEQKTYPVSVRADRQGEVTVEDVMTVLRDHYQGTEFDTSKGAKAGPFGNPTQYDPNQYTAAGIPGGWERPISVFRQLFSFVAVSRAWLPDEIGGMFWFGQAQAHTTAYVPIYASATHAPRSYRQVLQTEFSQDAAWWAFNFVSNWANLKYAYMSTDIQAAQAQAQALGRSLQLGVEATALSILQDASWDVVGGDSSMNAAVADMLTSAVVDHANRVTREWWALAWRLVAKYSDGYIARTDGSAGRDMPGYPEPWLKAVGFEDFPGESFINPRAPQPEPAVQDSRGVGELTRPSHKASRREIM